MFYVLQFTVYEDILHIILILYYNIGISYKYGNRKRRFTTLPIL